MFEKNWYNKIVHDFLQAHGGWKEIDCLMPRFVALSQNYISYDTKLAVPYFENRSVLIRCVYIVLKRIRNIIRSK